MLQSIALMGSLVALHRGVVRNCPFYQNLDEERHSHCISTSLEYRGWQDNLLRLLVDVGFTECPISSTLTSLVPPLRSQI